MILAAGEIWPPYSIESQHHCMFLERWNNHKKCFQYLKTLFISIEDGIAKYTRNTMAFWCRMGLIVFFLHKKTHRENKISCIFLQSPYQVDTKNVVKWRKYILWYSITLYKYTVSTVHCVFDLSTSFNTIKSFFSTLHSLGNHFWLQQTSDLSYFLQLQS